MADTKESLQKNIDTKTKELDDLKSKILAEVEATKKKNFEAQKIKLEEEIKLLQDQLDALKEVEKTTTSDQTNKETTALKDSIEVDSDQTYELMKDSKMHTKLLTVLGTEDKVEAFALQIDKVVRKFLDQELDGFSNKIKNSMSVGIQFAMMETLIEQGADGSAEFFTAFSSTKTDSGTSAFEGLYKAFGKLGSANKFYVLANKVQNLTWYLSDKKSTITASENIPELMNPVKFKTLLNKPVWSTQTQIDKLDITTILSLDTSTGVELSDADKLELKKIVDSDAISGVITEKTITAIQKSLTTADKLLDTREKVKTKASDLVSTIAGVLDIDIPFLGNLGEMIGMDFPTDMLGKKKDGGVMNFVLGILGFRGGISGLHKEYIQEKLTDLKIDNTFITAAYAAFQKDKDTTITNESATGTRTTCALTASDTTTETAIKAKIPADYIGLKKSIVDNLSTGTLNPTMVAKFAPALVTTENDISIIDMSQITGKEDAFVDEYLKYIIPLLADSTDDFITSTNVDQNSFALAVIGGLIGDKYFIEGINVGLLSATDFKDSTIVEKPVDASGSIDVINGQVDFSKGKFTDIQKKNINFLIDEMTKEGITNVYTQIGILSVISKESGFVPISEYGYSSTPNADIRKKFGTRITLSDLELDELKKKSIEEFDKTFFDMIYGKNATKILGRETGNTEVGDGYTYRGRGYNQITFKASYKKYGDKIGEDLVTNPDRLNDPIVASKLALLFFTDGNKGKALSTLTFTDKTTATKFFTDINAGGHANSYENALAASQKFDVKEKTVV